MIRAAGLIWFVLAGPLAALELDLPGSARMTAERNTNPDRYAAPVGVFADGKVPTLMVEGNVHRSAWRLETAGLTPLQIILPLRDQIVAAGYEILLDCSDLECGGYDFRFATEVLPGPNMYVNIRSYHVITAQRAGADGASGVISILASASPSSSYVQIIDAGSMTSRVTNTLPKAEVIGVDSDPPHSGDLGAKLLGQGHVILRDLVFESGTSDLGSGPFSTLEALAAFMIAQPGVRIALVGHTDSVGSLDVNIALSKRRAQSVRQRLIDVYAILEGRLEAEGMGYLAPVASNLDSSGRDENRRVEAILLSAD